MKRISTLSCFEEQTVTQDLADEIQKGLMSFPKTLPAKCFYDDVGSEIFEEICKLEEYYLTRTEQSIFERALPEIRETLPSAITLIEFGSGSSRKTRMLLDEIRGIRRYVPIDIARDFLLGASQSIVRGYPDVEVLPVCADFSKPFSLPREIYEGPETRVFFFPGSTIGNLTPCEAGVLLRSVSEMAMPGGGLLIGVDLKKDPELLDAAYNDSKGVTAAFNLNALAHINREFGGNFDLNEFEHVAFYNEKEGRIEMHLRSKRAHVVFIDNYTVPFDEGETIHTENSYKYSLPEFQRLAASNGFTVDRVWVDSDNLFSIQYLSADGAN